MPDGKKILSLQISVIFYEFNSWLLIIKSDRYDLSYHRNFLMVFKATIAIEWNGWGNNRDRWFSDGFWVPQPLCSMVFDGCPSSVKQWSAMDHLSSLLGNIGKQFY